LKIHISINLFVRKKKQTIRFIDKNCSMVDKSKQDKEKKVDNYLLMIIDDENNLDMMKEMNNNVVKLAKTITIVFKDK